MKLTKYTHACLVIEEQGQRLVIDPGEWSTDLTDLSSIAVVVITHSHFDHCNADIIKAIVSANPNAKIFGTAEVVTQTPGATMVQAGSSATIGPFNLKFYGERHALVHANQPQCQNVGVLVNDTLYYPGDSFSVPGDGAPIKVLALPISGPWLKLGEAMDFAAAIKPQICLPTHDKMLSKEGKATTDDWVAPWCESFHTKYQRLEPGDSRTF